MNSSGDRARGFLTSGRGPLPRSPSGRLDARGDLLQRMPRRDLRTAALVHDLRDAVTADGARHQALSLERLETRHVDRLERQDRLKTLDRSRVQLASGRQRT